MPDKAEMKALEILEMVIITLLVGVGFGIAMLVEKAARCPACGSRNFKQVAVTKSSDYSITGYRCLGCNAPFSRRKMYV